MSLGKKIMIVFVAVAVMSAVFVPLALCQDQKLEKYVTDTATSEKGMTLWQTIVAGGSLMVVLGLLSVAGLALVIYYFLTIKPEKLMPESFVESVASLLEHGKCDEAGKLCDEKSNLVSDVVLAGLARKGKGKLMVKEAMEDQGRRSIDKLWLRLSYLADIAVVSPLVGLLGTILGMMQAFNIIAFQIGAVKPILLAGGITKAMVTTAAGLMIAIPAMILYSYFRGKVQSVAAQFENVSAELFHVLAEKEG